jgi:hypothetical protein
MKNVLGADLVSHFDIGAIQVPMVSAPFKASFMLPVPEASVPAVEICSDRSAAGMMSSALETS